LHVPVDVPPLRPWTGYRRQPAEKPAAEPTDASAETTTAIVEPEAITDFVPTVKRSELRKARREAEETGNYDKLNALTGAIPAVEPRPDTSEVPVRAATWREVWGLPDPNTESEPKGSDNA